jgi:hypothetical protein
VKFVLGKSCFVLEKLFWVGPLGSVFYFFKQKQVEKAEPNTPLIKYQHKHVHIIGLKVQTTNVGNHSQRLIPTIQISCVVIATPFPSNSTHIFVKSNKIRMLAITLKGIYS